MVIQIWKLGVFSLRQTETFAKCSSWSNPVIVAALSVYRVTVVWIGTTINAVRQAKTSALVEEGQSIAEAENLIVSSLSNTQPNPIVLICWLELCKEPSV